MNDRQRQTKRGRTKALEKEIDAIVVAATQNNSNNNNEVFDVDAEVVFSDEDDKSKAGGQSKDKAPTATAVTPIVPPAKKPKNSKTTNGTTPAAPIPVLAKASKAKSTPRKKVTAVSPPKQRMSSFLLIILSQDLMIVNRSRDWKESQNKRCQWGSYKQKIVSASVAKFVSATGL